jgi:DNA-directed RNA polymerase subunit N (RpoN/RPB10)
MIIPPRCFTCGKVLSDKYNYFKNELNKYNRENNTDILNKTENMNTNEIKKTKCGLILDELGLTKYCCRRVFLSHVDLIDHI